MVKPSFRTCHKDWSAFVKILQDALNEGVPADEFETVTDCLKAASAELTEIEDKALQNSEKEYKALTGKIKDVKDDLEEVKEERDRIIKSAGEADQMLALLTKLIPLLA